MTGWEDGLWNDLECVEWDVKTLLRLFIYVAGKIEPIALGLGLHLPRH